VYFDPVTRFGSSFRAFISFKGKNWFTRPGRPTASTNSWNWITPIRRPTYKLSVPLTIFAGSFSLVLVTSPRFSFCLRSEFAIRPLLSLQSFFSFPPFERPISSESRNSIHTPKLFRYSPLSAYAPEKRPFRDHLGSPLYGPSLCLP